MTMILDEVMPNPEHTVVAHIVVDASPVTTWRAVRQANLLADPRVRWLFALRDLPAFAWNRLRGRPATLVPPSISFDDISRLEGWVVLGEDEEREVVLGSIGRFWQRDYGWTEVVPEAFAGFDDPGYAKTVAGLSLRPYGRHKTLLSYESRTSTTDPDASRKFRRYWFVLRPFVGLVMRRALAAIRAGACSASALLVTEQ